MLRHGNDLTSTSWQTINREFVGEARSVLLLIDLLLSIPATSVEAERGFSTMKLVKTDFRSKLSNTALNNLLRIVLLSPTEAEFSPTPAIEHWYNAVGRRQGTGRRQNDDDTGVDLGGIPLSRAPQIFRRNTRYAGTVIRPDYQFLPRFGDLILRLTSLY